MHACRAARPTDPKVVRIVTNTTKVRVRYAETDQMGVVYHSNFFIWFEVGRVELLRQLGFTYKEMDLQEGCFIAVVDASCLYKAPARYDEEITIRTHLKNVREALIHFAYEAVRDSDGTLLAEGETTHIVTDAHLNKRPLTQKYFEAFRRAAKGST